MVEKSQHSEDDQANEKCRVTEHHDLKGGKDTASPPPRLSRASSETREIIDLIKMISGGRDGKEVLRERRRSKLATHAAPGEPVKPIAAPAREAAAEVIAINQRIREDKSRRSAADRSKVDRMEARATQRATREQQQEERPSFERRLAWKRAFDWSRERQASIDDSVTAPYQAMVGLKRASSGCGSPIFKRSNSSGVALVD